MVWVFSLDLVRFSKPVLRGTSVMPRSRRFVLHLLLVLDLSQVLRLLQKDILYLRVWRRSIAWTGWRHLEWLYLVYLIDWTYQIDWLLAPTPRLSNYHCPLRLRLYELSLGLNILLELLVERISLLSQRFYLRVMLLQLLLYNFVFFFQGIPLKLVIHV